MGCSIGSVLDRRCIHLVEVLRRRCLQVLGEEEYADVDDARLGGSLKPHVLVSGKVLGTPLEQIAVACSACAQELSRFARVHEGVPP